MKLLIGVVVTLLFCIQMQTLQALLFGLKSKCESDLSTFKAAVKAWHSDFEYEQDDAQDQLNVVRNGYKEVNGILIKALVTKPTESQIKEIFDRFCEVHEEVQPAITQFRLKFDVLTRLLDSFINEQKVDCNNTLTGSGCEAETNREKCDLLAFRDGLAVSVVKAKTLLDARIQYCDRLYGLRRVFYIQYRPSDDNQRCGCGAGQSGSGSSVVVNEFVNNFVPSFRSPHDEAFGLVTEIGDVWNQILTAVKKLICKN